MKAEKEGKKYNPLDVFPEQKLTPEDIEAANMPNLSRKVIFDNSKEAEIHGSQVGKITHLEPIRHRAFPVNPYDLPNTAAPSKTAPTQPNKQQNKPTS